MASMNISLTPELMKVIKKKVSSGRYNNASEVVRDAIRRLDEYDNYLESLKVKNGKSALMPHPRLKPLPVVNGSVPGNWKEAIYDGTD